MSLFQQIEAALSDEEIATMHQWATNTSQGMRNHDVARDATYIVLTKLWDLFDRDQVDAWCQSLVKTKLKTQKKE